MQFSYLSWLSLHCCLRDSYKWNCAMCGLVWLSLSLSRMRSRLQLLSLLLLEPTSLVYIIVGVVLCLSRCGCRCYKPSRGHFVLTHFVSLECSALEWNCCVAWGLVFSLNRCTANCSVLQSGQCLEVFILPDRRRPLSSVHTGPGYAVDFGLCFYNGQQYWESWCAYW